MMIKSLEELNKVIREKLDSFYKNHDAESFFSLCDLLEICRKQNLTKDMVPSLIEMQNVIVMG